MTTRFGGFEGEHLKEHQKAKAWRERLEMSPEELAEKVGYTRMSIYWFERGETPPNRNAKSGNAADRQIKPWVMQRYRRACGDLDAEMRGRKKGVKFEW